MKRIALAVIIGVSSLGFCLDYNVSGYFQNYEFIGFSNEGTYLAFEEFGQTVEGRPYSRIRIIDVEKNSFYGEAIKVIQIRSADEASFGIAQSTVNPLDVVKVDAFGERVRLAKEGQSVRESALSVAHPKFKSLGIIKGNTGSHVIAHPMTDLTNPHKVIFKTNFRNHPGPIYELTLTESSDPASPSSEDKKLFELVLRNRDTNQARVLQKDVRLPKSRGWALGYRICDVYTLIHQDQRTYSIAVFLNVFSEATEGPDVKHMVVTGVLN